MATLVNRIVEFSETLRFEDLPAAVATESKRLLLDSIGCAVAALDTDKGRITLQVANEMGGPPEAKIIGTGNAASISAAAFANGELVNTLDYDALISPPGHVAPYVIPSILAVAEKHRSSGRNLIRALAVAHEISARFGRAMADVRDVPAGEKISFPAVTGYSSSIFGGTLGTAMLAGLDRYQAASALGLAGHIAPAQSMGKWVRTMPATTEKYLLAGWINQAEILAVNLARNGYRGDVTVLEGDFGFWRFMGSGRWNPDALLAKLGDEWLLPNAAIYKPYAHCRISQTVLDCLAHLMDEHQLNPDEIERIDAYCDPHGARLPMWSTNKIETCLDAQMSVPFAVSLLAHRVANGAEWQHTATLTNPRYLAFMNKVTVRAHPDFERVIKQEPGTRIGKVDVFARRRTFSEERKYRKGSPATAETRMSDDELVHKFHHNCERFLSPRVTHQLSELIIHLERIEDVAQITELL